MRLNNIFVWRLKHINNNARTVKQAQPPVQENQKHERGQSVGDFDRIAEYKVCYEHNGNCLRAMYYGLDARY